MSKLHADYPNITESEFLPFQNLKAIAQLSSPVPSTLHLDHAQKGEEHRVSPSPVRPRRGILAMSGQRFPFIRNESKMMVPEIPKVTVSTATEGFDEPPPSRPIPLIALSSRASSRNKGVKSWKPFPFSEVESSNTKAPTSNRNLSETSQYDPRAYHPALRQPTSANNSVGLHQRDPIPIPEYHPQEQTLEDRGNTKQQGWMGGAGANISRNPLSYSGGYSAYAGSYPQQQAYNAEDPYSGNENCLYMEYSTGFSNQFAVPAGRPSLGGVQSSYVPNLISEGHSMPEPNYLYPGYPQYMSSPYRLPSHEHQSHNQMIARQSAPILQSAASYPDLMHESHNVHRRLKTDGTYSSVNERLLNLVGPPVPTNPVAQLQRPNITFVPPSNTGRHSKAIEIKPPKPSPDPSNTVKKAQSTEEIKAYLKKFVQESIAAEEKKVNVAIPQNPIVKAENNSEKNDQKGVHKVADESSIGVVAEEPAQESQMPEKESESEKNLVPAKEPESEKNSSIIHKPLTAREEFRLLVAESEPEPWPARPVEDQLHESSWFKRYSAKTLRPPPGLPDRTASAQGRLSPIGSHITRQKAILEGADKWFHTDNRGDGELRQQVAEIAQAHSEELARSKGLTDPKEDAEIEESKQMTLLLGNAILNLQSYTAGNRDAQASNFANFGPAPPHCYEPTLGDRRSFFDRDPFSDYWRPPTGQDIPAFGDEEEKPKDLFK